MPSQRPQSNTEPDSVPKELKPLLECLQNTLERLKDAKKPAERKELLVTMRLLLLEADKLTSEPHPLRSEKNARVQDSLTSG